MAGGGYWGGYMSNSSNASSGAGGSGYISGHEGCIAINSQSDITPKVQTYASLEDSYHYSGKVFTNTELTAGATDTSKATITPLSMTAEEYPILDINVDIGKMCRKFNPAENDYYIELDKEQAYPTITITPSSDNVEVEGGLIQQVETIAGETKKQIKVKTAEGIEFVYNLYFYRKPSSNSYLKNIKVAGRDIENYKEETLRYEIELPYNVEENTIIEAIKKFPGQTIVGDGEVETKNSTTIHTIQVTSEDGTSTTEYNLILNKLERWRHKLRQWPKNVDNNKTLEELLNKAYNKEERDEINKRIAYLWENQDKTTMIYDIMVKSFGISGKEKYNSEKLNSRERNLLDSKLSNWASKIQRINFWPLKKGENKNKKTYDGKYLWELLQVTKEELSRLFDKIVVFDKNEITKEEKDLYTLNDMMYNELYENGGLAFHLKFMYPQTITNRWM